MNEDADLDIFVRFKKNVRNKLLAGFFVVLPIFVTFTIIKFMFSFFGERLLPIIKRHVKHEFIIPESIIDPVLIFIGIIITFIALYFIGLFASNFFGKKMIAFYERIIHNMPLVKTIYSSSKQVISSFHSSGNKSFKRVVFVDFPRTGMKMLGFVTGSAKNQDGNDLVSVFVPTTPNPTTGFLVYVSKKEIFDTNMSVEVAIKLLLSGGILVPENFDFQIPKSPSM